jgi:hypothetical protein
MRSMEFCSSCNSLDFLIYVQGPTEQGEPVEYADAGLRISAKSLMFSFFNRNRQHLLFSRVLLVFCVEFDQNLCDCVSRWSSPGVNVGFPGGEGSAANGIVTIFSFITVSFYLI